MDLRDIVREARRQGWKVLPTKGGHLEFRSPQGQRIFGPSTPSDWRAVRNLLAHLKRGGFEWPPKKR